MDREEMTTDRRVANRLLAKTLAYHECGKPGLAGIHAAGLIHFLKQIGIDPVQAPSATEACVEITERSLRP